jgi:PAS domain S-box-containing protein
VDHSGADDVLGFEVVGGFDPDTAQRALFQATPVPTVVVDLDHRTVTVNGAFRRLFGFATDRITMDQLDAITRPEDRQELQEQRQLLAGGGGSVSIDKRYLRPDGTEFWGHLTAEPLFDRDGRRWGVIASIADVTDRVEARAALLESEQRFRALVQNATDAIVVLDAQGRLVYATPSGERLTGNRTEDVVGSDIFQYVHPDDRAVVAQSFLSVFDPPAPEDEPTVPLQFRVLHNDGSVRFVEAISTNLLDEPAVRGVVVNIRDLTDSAVALSALEITENRFRRMVENISDTVTLIDADGHVVQSTGNVESIMGYPIGFWEERNVFDLIHPDDARRITESFALLREAPGADMSGEMRVRAADGSWADAEVYAVNLLHDPDVAAVVLTTRNISDRKRAERELNAARDQALQALQMRTEFIASVSHELRSPIHGILGLAELLGTADLDEDARQLTHSIGRATETLRMVLDDILDYSKIEVGRLEIEPRPLQVAEIAEDLLALFGPEAGAKGISLVVDADPDFPQYVSVDGLRVRQVLTNLVGNAVKFTTTGEVRVRAQLEPAVPGAPTQVRIEVSDTGIGIPPEAHGRLFQPFSQAHTSTAREFGGTGLGLSIAKRLVELMGGALGFESVPGRGSTFWFVLPVEILDEPDGIEEPPLADHPSLPVVTRVMVVEDNAVNQLLVRRQLERLGFDAVVFDSGAAAIEQFGETDADVVLMDWQLPGLDGIETTRRLRAVEQELGRARTPIVAMTASAMPGDRERCLASGMDDFIAKPVSMVMLGEVIRRWSSRRDHEPGTPAPTGSELAPAAATVEGPGDPLRGRLAPRSVRIAPDEPVGRPAVTDDAAAVVNGTTDTGATGVIDIAVLDRLVEDLSDPMLVASVVRTFLRELQPRVDAIEKAQVDGDLEALDVAAHVLRSTSTAVGATRLSTLCRQLERGGSASAVPASAIRDEADQVRAELARQLLTLVP